MNTKIIGIGILGLVVISVITVLVFVRPIDMTPPRKESDFKDWNRSGPFAINKKEYNLNIIWNLLTFLVWAKKYKITV